MGVIDWFTFTWVNEPMNFLILPLVGMIIGYATNWIAIKLLFWPHEKHFGIQGVIPKRKGEIAAATAKSFLNVLPKSLDDIRKMPVIGKKINKFFEEGITEKVNALDNYQIQKSVENVTGTELKFIKFSGAVLGFAIGIIQALILEVI